MGGGWWCEDRIKGATFILKEPSFSERQTCRMGRGQGALQAWLAKEEPGTCWLGALAEPLTGREYGCSKWRIKDTRGQDSHALGLQEVSHVGLDPWQGGKIR